MELINLVICHNTSTILLTDNVFITCIECCVTLKCWRTNITCISFFGFWICIISISPLSFSKFLCWASYCLLPAFVCHFFNLLTKGVIYVTICLFSSSVLWTGAYNVYPFFPEPNLSNENDYCTKWLKYIAEKII